MESLSLALHVYPFNTVMIVSYLSLSLSLDHHLGLLPPVSIGCDDARMARNNNNNDNNDIECDLSGRAASDVIGIMILVPPTMSAS